MVSIRLNCNILDVQGKNIIVAQVNCMGKFVDEFSVELRKKYPEVYEEYKKLCRHFEKDPESLLGRHLYVQTHTDVVVLLIFCQFDYGKKKAESSTNYKILADRLVDLILNVTNEDCQYHNYHVLIPYGLGCGSNVTLWKENVFILISKIFNKYACDVIICRQPDPDMTIYGVIKK